MIRRRAHERRGAVAVLAAIAGRSALVALLAHGAGPAAAAGASPRCELVVTAHRSGAELARIALDPAAPQIAVAFTHSVLDTPVLDRYAWRGGRWLLVEETFEGEGYGLPHAAGPGERLVRSGVGWRLELERVVDPLVVLPLPSQRMRLVVAGRPELALAQLSKQSVALGTAGCDGMRSAAQARPSP